jgi:vacuolar protein sorting-associated protein 52
MILWPKFEELFDFHLKALQACSVQHFRRLEKTASSKTVVDRFVDLIVALYRLYIHFQNSMLMLEKRLQALRKGFFELANKARVEFERESDGLTYYLGILEQVHQVCTADPIVANFKEFHLYQQELEKEIGTFADKLIVIYIREFFPGLDAFIRKYAKEEGAIA